MNFEWEHKRPDGSTFIADVTLVCTILNEKKIIQVTIRDITDILKVQKELRQNEARQRNILSSLHNAFIGVISPDLTYVDFWGSESLDEKYGMMNKGVIGKPALDFAPPLKRKEFRSMLETVLKTGQPTTLEVEGELPSGKFNQMMTLSPFRDEKGNITGIVQFGNDTTEKHLAYEKVKETNERYQLLDENISDVIWMVDEMLDYIYLSSSVEHLSGYRPDELTGTNIRDSLLYRSMSRASSDVFSQLEDHLKGVNEFHGPQKIELEIKKKGGGSVWTEVHFNIMRTKNEKIKGIVGITRDISQRREYQKKLEKMLSAFKLTSNGIIITDLTGRIKEVNEAFLKMFKIPDIEMAIGMDGLSHLSDNEKEKAKENISNLIKDGERFGDHYSVIDQDGYIMEILTSAEILKDELDEPAGFVITCTDVTEERKALRELQTSTTILRSIGLFTQTYLRGNVDEKELTDALGALGEALGISRVYISQNHPGEGGGQLTSLVHEWAVKGIDTQMKKEKLKDLDYSKSGFKRWADTLEKKKVIMGPVNSFPDEEKGTLLAQGIKSILVVPIFVNDRWWGFIGFDDHMADRVWKDSEIDALKIASGIFGYSVQKTS